MSPEVEKGVQMTTNSNPIENEQMYSLDPIRTFDREVQELIATCVNEKVMSIVGQIDKGASKVELMVAEAPEEKKGPSERELELEALVPQLQAKIASLEKSKQNLMGEIELADEKTKKYQEEVQVMKKEFGGLEERNKDLQSSL